MNYVGLYVGNAPPVDDTRTMPAAFYYTHRFNISLFYIPLYPSSHSPLFFDFINHYVFQNFLSAFGYHPPTARPLFNDLQRESMFRLPKWLLVSKRRVLADDPPPPLMFNFSLKKSVAPRQKKIPKKINFFKLERKKG